MTSLTPATVRLDFKCGRGGIAAGKTCRKGGALPSRKAMAAGLTAGAIGTALVFRSSRQAIFKAPGQARRAAQQGITELVHRTTAKKPSMHFPEDGPLGTMRRPSKTEQMSALARRSREEARTSIKKTAKAEMERAATVGEAMYHSGKATGLTARNLMRQARLRTEAARRRYEPGYRRPFFADKPRGDAPSHISFSAPQVIDPARRDTDDGKKYTKIVTNPKTGRKNRVRYGAKGYTIAPGTSKGDNYCARSFGDMKSHGKDCSGPDRNTPLCLSRIKWACSGKTSRRDGLTPGKSLAW